MLIQLEEIVFDHVAGAASADALSIRVDRATPAPSWSRGSGQPSRAAYALAPTLGHSLGIKARFSFDPALVPGAPAQVRVRGRAENGRDILGDVKSAPVSVAPTSATTAPIAFTLSAPKIWSRGIGKYDAAWIWEFQLAPASPWLPFDRSEHTVYVTLDLPRAPWSQDAAAPLDLPWTRALDWACRWASGTRLTPATLATASKKVARQIESSIYSLGLPDSGVLHYNGGFCYTTEGDDSDPGIFFCTAFLELLEGNGMREPTVNCSDCASIVVTFANLLGAQLSQKAITRTDFDAFATQPVVAIGEAGSDSFEFTFHEFATHAGATVPAIHDACAEIDRDRNPTDRKHDFGLARGMPLGTLLKNPPSFGYGHRFVAKRHWGLVKSDAVPIRRLDVAGSAVTPPDTIVKRLQTRYLKAIEAVAPPTDTHFAKMAIVAPLPLPGYGPYHHVPNPPIFAALTSLAPDSSKALYVERPAGRPRRVADRRVQVSLARSDSDVKARRALSWLMAQDDAPLAPLDARQPAGEPPRRGVAFVSPRRATLYWVRGNVLGRIVSIGRSLAPLAAILAAVDAELARRAAAVPL